MHETFSIHFFGTAFDHCEGDDCIISPAALAQSLLALDGLAGRAAKALYGNDCEAEIEVRPGFRPGSFLVDIAAACKNDPSAAAAVLAAGPTAAGGVVHTLKAVIKLGKFAFGKKVEVDPGKVDGDAVSVTNAIGQTQTFGLTAASLHNLARTRSQLSRLTQTLDQEGVDSIRISRDDNDPTAEVIEKRDRAYFRHEEGVVLTDNEADMILEIVGAMTNGSGKGWQFSEGCGGIEFHADVEDEDFLNRIKSGEIIFENGTAVRAIVRTVQHLTNKTVTDRTVTDRTVVEVKELLPPSSERF